MEREEWRKKREKMRECAQRFRVNACDTRCSYD